MQDMHTREDAPGFTSAVDNQSDAEQLGMQVDTGNAAEVEQAARRKMKHIISLMQD